MNYQVISQYIFRFIAIILSLSIHEYSHGLISYVQGDDTPAKYGRLTINPLAHLDLIGFIALMIAPIGWAKPVPISSANYKRPRLGIILTSIAGPLSNLLLAFFSMLVLALLKQPSEPVSLFLLMMIYINVGLAVFNLLPIPPLDGSKVFAELFGGKVAEFIYRIERVGLFILLLIICIPQVNSFINDAVNQIIVGMEYIINLII